MLPTLKIPEGYKYCNQCKVVSPFVGVVGYRWGGWCRQHHEDTMMCVLCGIAQDKEDIYLCPTCGWEHVPDRDLLPMTVMAQVHDEGCPGYETPEENVWFHRNCDCPEVLIYPLGDCRIINYSERKEWEYTVICPICFTRFQVDDTIRRYDGNN